MRCNSIIGVISVDEIRELLSKYTGYPFHQFAQPAVTAHSIVSAMLLGEPAYLVFDKHYPDLGRHYYEPGTGSGGELGRYIYEYVEPEILRQLNEVCLELTEVAFDQSLIKVTIQPLTNSTAAYLPIRFELRRDHVDLNNR